MMKIIQIRHAILQLFHGMKKACDVSDMYDAGAGHLPSRLLNACAELMQTDYERGNIHLLSHTHPCQKQATATK